MIHRIVAAGIALLGASCLAAPLAISAGMSGGMGANMSRHPAAPSMPLVDPGKPVPNPSPPHLSRFHQHFAFGSFRQHGRFAPGTPLWLGYGPSYYPVAEAEPSQPQVYGYAPPEFAAPARPPLFHVPDCRTDTVTVPSESGGHRAINITRCY